MIEIFIKIEFDKDVFRNIYSSLLRKVKCKEKKGGEGQSGGMKVRKREERKFYSSLIFIYIIHQFFEGKKNKRKIHLFKIFYSGGVLC